MIKNLQVDELKKWTTCNEIIGLKFKFDN